MNQMIKSAAAELINIEQQRVSGALSPVMAGDARETVLIQAVLNLAQSVGVELRPIHAIDGRGELSIVSAKRKPEDLAGPVFSPEFCELLNKHCRPRCGAFPGAVMDRESSNWCYINHFDAEFMIMAAAGYDFSNS